MYSPTANYLKIEKDKQSKKVKRNINKMEINKMKKK